MHVRIPTADSDVTLGAELVLPGSAGAWPTLVTVLPYRKDSPLGLLFREGPMRWFADHGYASVLVDVRGTGASDGEQRPPFHPDEADDAIAAIEWAAEQPWSTGAVGMWGHSYGALLTMRAASRRPRSLRAILVIEGMIDPARDFVQPGGLPAFLDPLQWSAMTLFSQLLPPLDAFGSPDEQSRWTRRLNDTDPYLVDVFARRPTDHERARHAVDVGAVAVPALCVAGWRDVFCAATIQAFERLAGPKRLLIGPWTHTMPDVAPVGPVDILAIGKAWWDRWLCGKPSQHDEEPTVTLYVDGARPEWVTLPSWPARASVTTVATDDASSVPVGHVEATSRSDATVGSAGGLWGSVNALPVALDQHDDDARSLTVTTTPLEAELVVLGPPEVEVTFAQTAPDRVVVRLCDVDPAGRSRLITLGHGIVTDSIGRLRLSPTAYRFGVGHRVRVAVSDSDFPRLQPVRGSAQLHLASLTAHLPIASELRSADSPPPPGPIPAHLVSLATWGVPRFSVMRDPIAETVTIAFGSEANIASPRGDFTLSMAQATTASAGATDACAEVSVTADVQFAAGPSVHVGVRGRLNMAEVVFEGDVRVDGEGRHTRTWRFSPGIA